MILVKNRLGKFYEQIFREIFTNVWEIFTNVWEIATNVWETPCPGKIVSVVYFDIVERLWKINNWPRLQSVSNCPQVSRILWTKNAHADTLLSVVECGQSLSISIN